jgi:hypothetical protein
MMLAVISFLTPDADKESAATATAAAAAAAGESVVNGSSIYLHTICFDYKSVGAR